MNCKVKKIINKHELEIEPAWNWNDCSGNTIKLNNDFSVHPVDWTQLLQDKEIELRYPVLLDCGSLLCEVYIEGKNIKEMY